MQYSPPSYYVFSLDSNILLSTLLSNNFKP